MTDRYVLQTVSYRYPGAGGVALDGISLEIGAKEFLACIGRSGSGKSTLLRLLAGLARPAMGSVELDGSRTDTITPRERQIGFVPQKHAIYPTLSVEDQIRLLLREREFPLSNIASRVEAVLHVCDLRELRNSEGQNLSGGEAQRLALARAVCWKPRVLLLDEPLASVDAVARPRLLEMIRTVHDTEGCTTIMVTHIAADAMRVADRIAILDDGRMVANATPQELVELPPTVGVAQLIVDVPHSIQPGITGNSSPSGTSTIALTAFTLHGHWQGQEPPPGLEVDCVVPSRALRATPATGALADGVVTRQFRAGGDWVTLVEISTLQIPAVCDQVLAVGTPVVLGSGENPVFVYSRLSSEFTGRFVVGKPPDVHLPPSDPIEEPRL